MFLAIGLFLIVSNVEATFNEDSRVQVHLNLPWYIEFEFPRNNLFVPLALKAHINSNANGNTIKTIDYGLVISEDHRTFRNIKPQNFATYDVITAELLYTEYGHVQGDEDNGHLKNTRRRTKVFDYTISDKKTDVLRLQIKGDESTTTSESFSNFVTNIFKPTNTNAPIETSQNAINFPTNSNSAVDSKCQCDSNQTEGDEKQLLNTALMYGKFCTRLLLTGRTRPSAINAVDYIRDFIVDRLQLPHLSNHILQAKFIDDCLLFEMQATKDVLEILTRDRLTIKSTQYKIECTDRDFIEVSSLQRNV